MILFLCITLVFAEHLPLERQFPVSLYEKLCADKSLTPQDLWQLKVFDSDLQTFSLTGDTKNLDRAVIANLKQLAHYGYGKFTCNKKKAVFVTTPSDKSAADLRQSALCTEKLNYFVDLSGGKSTLKPNSKDYFESIYCNKKLWFIVPEGVAIDFFHKGISTENFLAWVNQIRKNEKLKVLKTNQSLTAIAKELSQSNMLEHDIAQMKKISERNKSLKLIGENRALGKSWQDHAQLFWISARHRDLLLDDTATQIGIYDAALENNLLKVVITAKD